jgi:hypothetical protein
LRVFAALEDQGGRQVILTKAQIERADAYSDAQAKARAQLQLYAQAAASEAIPAITDLTAVAVELAKEFLGVDEATGKLSANNGAKKFAEDAADALAFLVDQVDLVVRLFQTAGKTIAGVSAGGCGGRQGQLRCGEGHRPGALRGSRSGLDQGDIRRTSVEAAHGQRGVRIAAARRGSRLRASQCRQAEAELQLRPRRRWQGSR